MEYRPIFRRVDVLPVKHLVSVRLHLCFAREGDERVQDGRRDQVFGVVQEDLDIRTRSRVVLYGKFGESVWILRKEVFENESGPLVCVDVLELFPGWVVCYRRVRYLRL